MTAPFPAPPGLSFLTEVSVSVGEPVDVGPTPEGHRRMVPITGGTVRGPALNGRVLPGGADYQFLRGPTLTELDARYVLETDDGDRIFVHNTALRHGTARDIELLNSGAAVDPVKDLLPLLAPAHHRLPRPGLVEYAPHARDGRTAARPGGHQHLHGRLACLLIGVAT